LAVAVLEELLILSAELLWLDRTLHLALLPVRVEVEAEIKTALRLPVDLAEATAVIPPVKARVLEHQGKVLLAEIPVAVQVLGLAVEVLVR
jgi:hypothetical protein